MAQTGTTALLFMAALAASGQNVSPLGYSIATPRPINPAEGTTTPSAAATQRQNPYLGSVPAPPTGATIQLSLWGAIERGLRYNLGLIQSNQSGADARAARFRSLSALLPQISARGQQAYEDIAYKEIGLKLPAIPGLPPLAPTTGGFGFEDARVGVTQSIYNGQLIHEHRAKIQAEQASIANVQDSRDVVVFAVGVAYVQAIASAARVETARAQLASAQELDQQTADRTKSEVSPEIDSLRAQVERQSAEQRVTNAENQFEKDRLTLGRITGLDIDQNFTVGDPLAYHPLTALTYETAREEALRSRADLRSAEASVRASENLVQAQKAQRLPVVSVNADYGAGGANPGNFNQVYTVSGNVSVPVYTGGRIRADVEQARTELSRRQAEYADLKGRVAYDVRVAWLDAGASESSVKVAVRNRELAAQALAQSKDRYLNGVTNYLEVVQAQETVVSANDNYIQSLYSYDVALISLARAMGSAETRLRDLLGGN